MIGMPVRPETPGTLRQVAADITERFVRYTGEVGGPRRYAIWSPTSSYYGWEYGRQRPEQFAELREAFRASPYWHVDYESAGTVLFAFDPDAYVRGEG